MEELLGYACITYLIVAAVIGCTTAFCFVAQSEDRGIIHVTFASILMAVTWPVLLPLAYFRLRREEALEVSDVRRP